MFLGVPHHGTNAYFPAALLACTAKWRGSSTELLETMTLHNPSIERLDDDFRKNYTSTYIGNFLESQSEKIWRLSLTPVSVSKYGAWLHSNKFQTVNAESGEIEYAEENVYLHTDHRGLNKIKSADDDHFKKFHRVFLKACDHKVSR